MKQNFFKFIFFTCMGWQLKGFFDTSIKKCIFIVVPHTSWVDFFIGLFTRGVLNIEINYVGKQELFVFPIGFIFKWLGGAPLNRNQNEDKVKSITKIFNQKEVFRLALSPEGTRKKVTKWRTGFYYIAKETQVPIIPVAFDFKNKQVIIHKPFNISNNIEADFTFLEGLFTGIEGKNPEKSFSK